MVNYWKPMLTINSKHGIQLFYKLFKVKLIAVACRMCITCIHGIATMYVQPQNGRCLCVAEPTCHSMINNLIARIRTLAIGYFYIFYKLCKINLIGAPGKKCIICIPVMNTMCTLLQNFRCLGLAEPICHSMINYWKRSRSGILCMPLYAYTPATIPSACGFVLHI